jgi:anti-sigma factor RsiW
MMSREENKESQISELLQLWCDDRLDDAQSTALSELLATSVAARRRYVEIGELAALKQIRARQA